MKAGYTGKVLFVDLTAGLINEESLPDSIYRDFIGGEGLGARVLYERQRGDVDALGPENTLGFVTGLLTGCGVPSASRCTVVTKSPLTGTWGDANVGGYFGSELKASGYDAIFFKGIAPHPVYLLITESKIELKDATHLWGKDTTDTVRVLREEVGDPRIRVACIGPAGETLSLISAIIMEGRAAARSGVGAVMGAKRLKAIAVRGNKAVATANPEALKAMQRDLIKDIKESKSFMIKMLREQGTCGGLSAMVAVGDAPIKNWNLAGEEAMPTHSKLNGENITKYQLRRAGCAGCPIQCGGIVKLGEGPYGVTETRQPEYETLVAFGTLCLNDDAESVIKANDMCDRYGIDTMSAGASIAFAMECYERGIITKSDLEGDELNWGNAPVILSMIEKMVKREGFGALLADGVKKAAEKIGRGAEECAIHVHGQEVPYHDPRMSAARGTMYISDPTPARHVRSSASAILERGGAVARYPEVKVSLASPEHYSGKGDLYAIGTKCSEVFVSCGFCSFLINIDTLPLMGLISAATGWDLTVAELLLTGERIQTLRHVFNIREGICPDDFRLPRRLQESPSLGPLKGVHIDFNKHREAYYRAMNWDPRTGRPSEACLKKLELAELVDTLSDVLEIL
jgi:aldehyde:ferredoxin oxidoreductase